MIYQEADLVRVAKRENNKKRNYLVVNPLQGKHIPVSPRQVFQMMDQLAEVLGSSYPKERLLLVGFAETATAIGARLAIKLESGYIQTTREEVSGVEYLYFTESHSHATEQKLVKDDLDRKLPCFDRVVFVEDEVTTGNTILNIVGILEKVYPGEIQYAVASLLNGMDEEALQRYQKHQIALHYLVKTDHSLYISKAENYSGDGEYISIGQRGNDQGTACFMQDYGTKQENNFKNNKGSVRNIQKVDCQEIFLSGYRNTRRFVEGKDYAHACESLWNQILRTCLAERGKRCLVLGTEEFMYPALFAAFKLEEAGCIVNCHATTRSPIIVSTEKGYPLHTRYELWSLYEERRKTYVYDLQAYDQVLIISDAPGNSPKGIESLANALLDAGNQNIIWYRWCENEKFLS